LWFSQLFTVTGCVTPHVATCNRAPVTSALAAEACRFALGSVRAGGSRTGLSSGKRGIVDHERCRRRGRGRCRCPASGRRASSRGQPEVYSKLAPGRRTGCWPTTPSPTTSCMRPSPSVIFQWRVISWSVRSPRVLDLDVVGPEELRSSSGRAFLLDEDRADADDDTVLRPQPRRSRCARHDSSASSSEAL
jgi:hypothetical protein